MTSKTNGQHVCFIFAALGLGGAEAQFEQYFRHRPPSVAVSVVYFCDLYDGRPDSMIPRLEQLGVAVHYFPLTKVSPAKLYKLVRLLQKLRPNIIHTVLAGSAGTWGRLAGWLAGAPMIVHSDRSLNPPVSLPHRLLRPLVDRLTDRFITNAVAIADWLAQLGVPRDKIITIPNGVELARFTPEKGRSSRTDLGIAETAVVAGFLGKLRPEKRIDLLLDSLTHLSALQRPDYVLVGGDGPVMGQLRQRVSKDPWLREHCRVMGLVSDVPGFLAKVDYLILCSDREGLPNVVLEAMAMGLPIVATEVSDVPLILDGVGFLAKPGDAQSLANAIRQMQLLTSEHRSHMGIQARRRVIERHAIERVADRFWTAHGCQEDPQCRS